MKSATRIARMLWPLSCALLLAACGTSHEMPAEHSGKAEQAERGPHGGRLFEDGDFALELAIFERGVPPEFRVYATRGGKAVPPDEIQVNVELKRVNGLPGGAVEQFTFTPREDHLVGSMEVHEPHSFTVTVRAEHAGQRRQWSYDSLEGRVSIPADVARAQGIRTASLAPGVIGDTILLYGNIHPDARRIRAVTARFPGVVQKVGVQVGDRVTAGQTLATVESNESLRSYAVTAPLTGIVTRRDINPGEQAGSVALFEIANFSTVWAELSVFPRDRARLRIGQSVQVVATDGEASGSGRVAYIASLGGTTQALQGRVELDNSAGQWTPGQFVNARVTVANASLPLVVPLSAVQSFGDRDVVAVVDGDQYQLQPVELGRRDAMHAEVLAGVKTGAQVVTENSYLIKADVEKSGAAHDH